MLERQLTVIMELENATALKDRETLLTSVNSVVSSLENLHTRTGVGSELIFSGEKTLGAWLMAKLEAKSTTSLGLKIFDNSGHGYFSAKMTALSLSFHEFIVFCDSDCVYELEYMFKMHQSMSRNPGAVVYGTTYSAVPRSRLEISSSLAWLFPPEQIGYAASWPKSTWANSMGMSRRTLEDHPFPEISVEGFPGLEIKQERPIWSTQTAIHSIPEIQVDATCYHKQFASWGDWCRRQFTHGVGFTVKQTTPTARMWASGSAGGVGRWRHLGTLRQSQKISRCDLWGARSFLFAAFLSRAIGYIAVRIRRGKLVVTWPR